MKLPWLIFGLLLMMCAALAAAFVTAEPQLVVSDRAEPIVAGHGIPHARIGTMQQGGDSKLRYAPVRIEAWLFGVCMIVFFSCLLVLATRKPNASRPLICWLLVGLVFHLLGMVGMLTLYEWYLEDSSPRLFAAFPAPSAWMMYVLWPAPVVFVLVYVLGFDRWIYGPEDEQAFAALLARRSKEMEPGEDAG